MDSARADCWICCHWLGRNWHATPPLLDDLGENLLAELLLAAPSASPRLFAMEDGLSAIGTHVGLRRRRNEERAAIARIDLGDRFSYTLFIVCDGAATKLLILLVRQSSRSSVKFLSIVTLVSCLPSWFVVQTMLFGIAFLDPHRRLCAHC